MSENGSAAIEHAVKVRAMFATIANRYDVLNHLLSGNVDRKWRRKVAQRIQERCADNSVRILDVACGTGDLSQTLFETIGGQVVGTDFCRPMLAIASRKIDNNIRLIESDALHLPFADRSFDVVTIAFGLRNLSNVEQGLTELRRVLRVGGSAAVLEFSKPKNKVFRPLFGFYFKRVLPIIGGLISGSKAAYIYLPDSVKRFPDQKELASLMEQAGFTEVGYENLTGGIAALHIGSRAE